MRRVYRVSADVLADGQRATREFRIASAGLDDVCAHLDAFTANRGWTVLRQGTLEIERKAARREPEGWVDLVSDAPAVGTRP